MNTFNYILHYFDTIDTIKFKGLLSINCLACNSQKLKLYNVKRGMAITF